MKGDDGDWIFVTGRPSRRRANVHIPRRGNLDESVWRCARDRVIREVHEAWKEAQKFLKIVLQTLHSHLGSQQTTRIVALGLGSPTALSLPLIRSCCCQLAVCLIVRETLNINRVDVFDPIMDVNDVEACRSLLHDFRVDLPGLQSLCESRHQIYQEDSGSAVSEPQLLLWMPHCEAALYRAVLLAIEAGADPLAAAKELCGAGGARSHMRYDLSNVVLVGNSLKDYGGDVAMPQHIIDRVVESALPVFDPFPQAFSGTYVTKFK
ncbi:hypothetical protein, conserved [Babesia bigemina]|uniref:SRR1-like domain-containing protein n=1 Tax=Babesia bigemina TaxID=5866 RepID=A0A061D5P4_BABBI|nr:hypothetical protein, conserved [Babesia bigemina]CDR94269.1 hypothetical protein, conserved [Babesia bigemina]|eukprot:XP_012766455.1 hypothetical protein, conserved [Babesia bigemina]